MTYDKSDDIKSIHERLNRIERKLDFTSTYKFYKKEFVDFVSTTTGKLTVGFVAIVLWNWSCK